MDTLPLLLRLRLRWHNVRVWVMNIIHPLTQAEQDANMEELLAGPQDEAPE